MYMNEIWLHKQGITFTFSLKPWRSCVTKFIKIQPVETTTKLSETEKNIAQNVSIGNSMICSDIWHKYQEWYNNF